MTSAWVRPVAATSSTGASIATVGAAAPSSRTNPARAIATSSRARIPTVVVPPAAVDTAAASPSRGTRSAKASRSASAR